MWIARNYNKKLENGVLLLFKEKPIRDIKNNRWVASLDEFPAGLFTYLCDIPCDIPITWEDDPIEVEMIKTKNQ